MLFVCPPTGSYRWFCFFQCTVEAEVSHEAHLPPVRDVLRYQGVLQVGFIRQLGTSRCNWCHVLPGGSKLTFALNFLKQERKLPLN